MSSHKATVSAVKCPSYDPYVVKKGVAVAIENAGGLPATVASGGKILIKPNLLTARSPDAATTTHPEIVRALIHYLRENGIDEISIGDSPAGSYSWQELWEKTGFAAMAQQENVNLLPFENIKRVESSEVGMVPFLKELDDFDAMISVPKLKTHMLTKITGAVKNSYGLIVGNAKSGYHGSFPSPRKMGMFISHFYQLAKPHFVVVDAVVCMEGDGPSDGKPRKLGIIFAGQDAVAVDSCACRAYGYTENDIIFLKQAIHDNCGVARFAEINRMGDGWQVLENARLKRSKADLLHRFPEGIFQLGTRLLSCKPRIRIDVCRKCGKCVEVCSQNAILKNRKGHYAIDKSKCVICVCCMEACPYHAIEMMSPGLAVSKFFKKLFSA